MPSSRLPARSGTMQAWAAAAITSSTPRVADAYEIASPRALPRRRISAVTKGAETPEPSATSPSGTGAIVSEPVIDAASSGPAVPPAASPTAATACAASSSRYRPAVHPRTDGRAVQTRSDVVSARIGVDVRGSRLAPPRAWARQSRAAPYEVVHPEVLAAHLGAVLRGELRDPAQDAPGGGAQRALQQPPGQVVECGPHGAVVVRRDGAQLVQPLQRAVQLPGQRHPGRRDVDLVARSDLHGRRFEGVEQGAD